MKTVGKLLLAALLAWLTVGMLVPDGPASPDDWAMWGTVSGCMIYAILCLVARRRPRYLESVAFGTAAGLLCTASIYLATQLEAYLPFLFLIGKAFGSSFADALYVGAILPLVYSVRSNTEEKPAAGNEG